MNHISTVLGLSLPSLRARDIVMKEGKLVGDAESVHFFPHTDSWALLDDPKQLLRDDDTLSTVSSFDESDSSLSSQSVSFAEPLVTEVRLRPYTSLAEKRDLFYTDREYQEFKRDFFSGRNQLVSFADSVVSNVWTIPAVADVSKAFYSETELQQFLDEFVASLEKGVAFD